MVALQEQFKGAAKCVPADPEKMLLPYQERWRADKSQIKLAEKSRQIGWTWTDALTSMEACVAGLWMLLHGFIDDRLHVPGVP